MATLSKATIETVTTLVNTACNANYSVTFDPATQWWVVIDVLADSTPQLVFMGRLQRLGLFIQSKWTGEIVESETLSNQPRLLESTDDELQRR